MEKPIRLGLIDDEQYALDQLGKKIRGIPGFDVAFAVTDPLKGYDRVLKGDCDVLITDIEMDTFNGILISKELETLNIPVIICSAYKEFTLEGIKASVLDYILKPASPLELFSALRKASKRIAQVRYNHEGSKKNFLLLNEEERATYARVLFDEIFYLEQTLNYTRYYVPPLIFRERSTLLESMEKLPKENFFQVHKSFVINTDKIMRIRPSEIELTNGMIVPKGRMYSEGLDRFLGLR